ncbi:septum formation initiator family protein [Patescibacteria group bacterium]|nr:septum formation initiator family protein [Patescibacteria group bacterium]
MRNISVQRILVSIGFLMVFGGGIGFLAYQNIKIYQKKSELQETLQFFEAQVVELSERKTELEESIEEVQSQEYQEKVLRERGLYKKPGEEVVTILPPEKTQDETSGEEEKKRIWWNPFTWGGDN